MFRGGNALMMYPICLARPLQFLKSKERDTGVLETWIGSKTPVLFFPEPTESGEGKKAPGCKKAVLTMRTGEKTLGGVA